MTFQANVVAQTKILYEKKQLYQLIYQDLLSDGLTETAASLLREANLDSPAAKSHSSFHYRSPLTSTVRINFCNFYIF